MTSCVVLASRTLKICCDMKGHKVYMNDWLISPLFTLKKFRSLEKGKKKTSFVSSPGYSQEKSLCFQTEWQLCHHLLAIGFTNWLSHCDKLKFLSADGTLILWWESMKPNLHTGSLTEKMVCLSSWDSISLHRNRSLGELYPRQSEKLQVRHSRCYGDSKAKGSLDSPIFPRRLPVSSPERWGLM